MEFFSTIKNKGERERKKDKEEEGEEEERGRKERGGEAVGKKGGEERWLLSTCRLGSTLHQVPAQKQKVSPLQSRI